MDNIENPFYKLKIKMIIAIIDISKSSSDVGFI